MPPRHILLIDDDEDDQEIFVTALKVVSSSILCTADEDARHALNELIAGNIFPDIIFLDLNMPLMNGQQFLREMRSTETLKKIPVIILSTTCNPVTMHEARNLGANQFMIKPNRFDELSHLLKSVLVDQAALGS